MGRPRSFDQSDTLGAICAQFWETGYAATSVDDLMNVTGLGKGSLYGAFGAKHDMFVSALAGYSSESLADFKARLEGDDAGALRRLKTCVRGAAKDAVDPKRGCMLANAIAELSGRDADVDRIAAGAFKGMEDALLASIRQAQRAGDLPAALDARRHALLLLAVLRGMEALGKAGASAASLRSVAEGALSNLTGARPGLARAS